MAKKQLSQEERQLNASVLRLFRKITTLSSDFSFDELPELLKSLQKELSALTPDNIELNSKILIKYIDELEHRGDRAMQQREDKARDLITRLETKMVSRSVGVVAHGTFYPKSRSQLNARQIKILDEYELVKGTFSHDYYKADIRTFQKILDECTNWLKTNTKKYVGTNRLKTKVKEKLTAPGRNAKEAWTQFKQKTKGEKALAVSGRLLQGLGFISKAPIFSAGGLLSGTSLLNKSDRMAEQRKIAQKYERDLLRQLNSSRRTTSRVATAREAQRNLIGRQIDKIKAAGGGSFITRGKTQFTVGDNPGGKELVSIIPLGKAGTTTMNGSAVKAAGGFAGIIKGAAAATKGALSGVGTAVRNNQRSGGDVRRVGGIQHLAAQDSSKSLKMALVAILISTRQIKAGVDSANTTLAAIADNTKGLNRITKSRSGATSRKIGGGPLPAAALTSTSPLQKDGGGQGFIGSLVTETLGNILGRRIDAALPGLMAAATPVILGGLGALLAGGLFTAFAFGVKKLLDDSGINAKLEQDGRDRQKKKEAEEAANGTTAAREARLAAAEAARAAAPPGKEDEAAGAAYLFGRPMFAAAAGGSRIVRESSWLNVGEAGPEHVSVTPLGGTGGTAFSEDSQRLARAQKKVFDGVRPIHVVIDEDKSKAAKQQQIVAEKQEELLNQSGIFEMGGMGEQPQGIFGRIKASVFGAPPSPGSLGPTQVNANVEGFGETGSSSEAMSFFQKSGWSKAQAAGIVGNLQAESGASMKTNAVGDGGKAYGIGQWHPDRQAQFQAVFGKPIQQATFSEQLQFVDWELKHTEKGAGQRLAQAQDPGTAAAVVDKFYERSAGFHRQQRIANANSLMGNTPVANGFGGGAPAGGTSTIVDKTVGNTKSFVAGAETAKLNIAAARTESSKFDRIASAAGNTINNVTNVNGGGQTAPPSVNITTGDVSSFASLLARAY